MRNVNRFIVLIGIAVAMIAPRAASAQSLREVLGVVTATTSYGYNSCSYVYDRSGQAFCQVNRAANVANTIAQLAEQRAFRRRQQVQERAQVERQAFDQRTQQLTALQRACDAGDQRSCVRSGGASGERMTVARALMDACTAGDRESCLRAQDMLDESTVVSNYRPTTDRTLAQNTVRPRAPVSQSTTSSSASGGCRPTVSNGQTWCY